MRGRNDRTNVYGSAARSAALIGSGSGSGSGRTYLRHADVRALGNGNGNDRHEMQSGYGRDHGRGHDHAHGLRWGDGRVCGRHAHRCGRVCDHRVHGHDHENESANDHPFEDI